MPKKSAQEIAAEVAALRRLKPTGLWRAKTTRSIEIQIEALEGHIDETSDEFSVELNEEQQDIATQAINWRDGVGSDQPSTGWGGLVE